MSADPNSQAHVKQRGPLTFRLQHLFVIVTIAAVAFALFALCGVNHPVELIGLSWISFCGFLYLRAGLIEQNEHAFAKVLVGALLIGIVAVWLNDNLSMLREFGR